MKPTHNSMYLNDCLYFYSFPIAQGFLINLLGGPEETTKRDGGPEIFGIYHSYLFHNYVDRGGGWRLGGGGEITIVPT